MDFDDDAERARDPFGPPAANVPVSCLHCGEEYDSWRIEWRILQDAEGRRHGSWCCPIPGCDGKGFGFDILPTDPNYRDEHGGWVEFDDDDEDFDDDEQKFVDDEGQIDFGRERFKPSEDDEVPF